jgi:hypothetical protein
LDLRVSTFEELGVNIYNIVILIFVKLTWFVLQVLRVKSIYVLILWLTSGNSKNMRGIIILIYEYK